MSIRLLTRALQSSFEAGLLVDGESCSILFSNEAAEELFGFSGTESWSRATIDSCISTVWTTDSPLVKDTDSLTWKEVVEYVGGRSDTRPSDEWLITGRKQDETAFPGVLKMALLEEEGHNDIVVIWIRHSDQHDGARSIASGQPLLRRRSSAKVPEPPPVTMNDGDTITSASSAQQQESILAAVFEASLDPLFQINSHGTIQMVNNAATKLFGWSRTDFLGNNISMICGGNHGPQHHNYMERYLATGETRIIGRKRELVARRQDGSEFPIELGVVECDTYLGDERLFCGFVRDLSSLKQKERLAAEMVDASLDPMFYVGENGTIHMINQAAVEKFGWSRAELVGQNIRLICGGDHAKSHDNYMEHYLTTGEAKVIGKNRELPARRKDGTEFPIELAVVELNSALGEQRMFCGFVHDLSDRKRKEGVIEGIIDTALDPLLMINERGVIELVNAAAERHLGWTKSELLGQNIKLLCGGGHANHHDEYLKRFIRTGVSHIIGKKRELLAMRKDGSQFLMELALCEVKVQDGDERRFAGFMRDLTQQKQLELDIRRREHFTNKIIETSPDPLFVVDSGGMIVRVNVAATSKFQWGASELEGSSMRKVLVSKDGETFMAELEQFLSVGIPVTAKWECQGVTKNGEKFPVSLHTVEVEKEEQGLFFAVYAEDLTDKKRRLQAEVEKAAAEVLLFNVLPEHIASRLKEDPSHIAESHDCATILFADIVGFTSMSNSMKPQEVVAMLNQLFSMFDDLVEQYHPLTKIKTIGDCYMATVVPLSQEDETEQVAAANCATVCHFALDMIEALGKFNESYQEHPLNLRVGINSGEVVAGVVGTKRYLYDLWGDAVNLASRMESTGVPGRIQISPNVVKLIGSDFETEKRGEVYVKGIGEVTTHFLVDRIAVSTKKPTPRPVKAKSEYTLLVDGIGQLDFARSMRILSKSHRGAVAEHIDDTDDDEDLSDLTGSQAFHLLKQSKR